MPVLSTKAAKAIASADSGRRFGRVYAAAAILALALHGGPVNAQDNVASITPQDLARVRSRIAREEERYETLKKGLKQTEQENERLKRELAEVNGRKDRLNAELGRSRADLARITARVDENRAALTARKEGMKQRITAIYKAQKRTGSLDYLFEARSAMDLLKRTTYLRRLTAYDRTFTDRVEKALQALSTDQQALDAARESQSKQLEELSRVEQDLNRKREEQAKLLDDAKAKTVQQEKALGRLRAEADRLEQVISGLTGGEQPVPPPDEIVPPEPGEVPQPRPTGPPPAPIELSREPYNGRGLLPLRGSLKFPVKGALVRKFGKQRHEEFADMLFLKGVEVSSAVGEKVRAIADGKVLMSQVLPGYGNVIIVDHGQRYYTLYGRLASSLKGVGDTVQRGEVVAILGEPDYRNRNFYFELRVKGKATDPLGYFADPPRQLAMAGGDGET